MGTRADFYIGRGPQAEWRGSIAWDGYPEGIGHKKSPLGRALLKAESSEDFRASAAAFLASRDDGTTPDMGWPWPWDNSRTTDYAYAFDDGTVYVSYFGNKYLSLSDHDRLHAEYEQALKKFEEGDGAGEEPTEDWWDDMGKEAFPDMSDRKAVALGKRSGVIVLGR